MQLSVRRKHLPFGRNHRGKNSSDTSTSGSHNFSVRTLIHANFISLESRPLKFSNGTLHDPFWVLEGLQNWPPKLDKKTIQAHKSRKIRQRCCMADKIATWQRHARHNLTMRHSSWGWATCVAQHHHAQTSAINQDPFPPHFSKVGSSF